MYLISYFLILILFVLNLMGCCISISMHKRNHILLLLQILKDVLLNFVVPLIRLDLHLVDKIQVNEVVISMG